MTDELEPYYADTWLQVYIGSCLDILRQLPAEEVDCVVTSPPYWGLRDYGTGSWIDGDPECDHVDPGLSNPVIGSRSTLHGGVPNLLAAQTAGARSSGSCRKGCGARRIDAQIGQEASPDEYVDALVDVFREVRRVLKPSGTCWLNLGDTYAVGSVSSVVGPNADPSMARHHRDSSRGTVERRSRAPAGLKPKDLTGIPWRVAFALQADGWYLRSEVIWSKPNAMPESVTDRPTKAHETVFLLTKSARYYYDADAVRQPWADERNGASGAWRQPYLDALGKDQEGSTLGSGPNVPGRNLRSVWTIPTQPYAGAHFAVFPPELPERCIAAGSSERGVCPACGRPWRRLVEVEYENPGNRSTNGRRGIAPDEGRVRTFAANKRLEKRTTHAGWLAPCAHELEPVPAVVLDPFAGSGTVGMVANHLSRRAVLIDLNPAYMHQVMDRNAMIPLGL